MPPSATNVRIDIQALRGLAVLAVVLYHAKLGAIGGGYLGVDIFFVLSGFLITGLIKKGIEDTSFSYRAFLLRRARRLLPASIFTFLVTALLAPVFLGAQELDDFWSQLAGAVTFTANFVLTSQSSYFSGAADLKPLLHVWSLAVEEQYYFVLPAILLLLPKRSWLAALVLLAIASLALCIINRGEASTFFLLPTRAWEMLIGSIGVFLVDVRWIKNLAAKLLPITTAGILACLIFTKSFHPGPQALLVCIGTLGVILARHASLNRGPVIGILHKIGNISYSLYLVHWPVFAFYNNVVLDDEQIPVQQLVRVLLVVLSFVLAWALNRYVEEPYRHGNARPSYRSAVALACSGLLALGLTQLVAPKGNDKDYAFARRANTGFSPACADNKPFSPKPECRNSSNPTVLVWGDSFAMHLIPGLSQQSLYPEHIVQATLGRCGPLLGIAPIEFSSEQWARECISFNDAVLAHLQERPEIRTVILSSPLGQYTKGKAVLKRGSADGDHIRSDGTIASGLAGLARTVEGIRALGRHVILMAPPPSEGFDVGRCLERQERGLWIAGVDVQCRIAVADYKRHANAVLTLIGKAEKELDLPVARFDDILCDRVFCRTRLDSVSLYRDEGHLSYEGSVALFQHPDMQRELRRALQQSAQREHGSAIAATLAN